MRIIITGGSGLIGRALTRELCQQGHEAIILSRSPQQVKGLPVGARAVAWDGRSAAGWGELVEGADVIVNLAGASLAGENPLQMRWTPKRKQVILQSRVNAGRAVVEAVKAARTKPSLLIQASAVGFYGPRDNQPMGEDHPAGADFQAEVCHLWEASTQEAEDMGVRRVVIRSGVVLAAENPALFWLVFPFRLFVGGRLGNGRQYFPWIHIEDVVGAMRFFIANQQTQGVYNLTAPDSITNRTLAKTLGHVLHRSAFIPAPAFLLRLVFGEVAGMLLEGQNAVPLRLQQDGYEFRFPKIEPALRDVLKK
jgi:uncharacterized protein (TIGR01777 family)